MSESQSNVSLIAAAAAASGVAPSDPGGLSTWLAGVSSLASDLYLAALELEATIKVFDECRMIPGVLLGVEERSGRGVLTLKASIGDNQDEPEHLRTDWLNTPAGAALFDKAKALVGQKVRVGKYTEPFKDGNDGKSKKMARVAWIKSAGPVATSAPTGPTRTINLPPARQQAPQQAAPQQAAPQQAAVATLTRTNKTPAELLALDPSTVADLLKYAAEEFGKDRSAVQEAADGVTVRPMDAWGQPQVIKVWAKMCGEVPF